MIDNNDNADTTAAAPAVLAGTWEYSTADMGQLIQLLLTFDANNNLIRVTHKVNGKATAVVESPSAMISVDGTDITISATFDDDGVIFTGELAADGLSMSGTAVVLIIRDDVTISIAGAASTFTRVS